MILNAYAILDGFLSLFRLGLAILVLGLAWSAWRQWRGPPAANGEFQRSFENHCYLLFLFAMLLLVLNLFSWPMLYLLLQSYVPEWPGVMCIYGVTKVGAESVGASRFLPSLLKVLQAAKPALVFCSGAWLVLYLINRRTPTAPLTGRILLALIVLGVLAGADALVELAYLAIPKKEEFLSVGCCTAAPESFDTSRFLPRAFLGDHARAGLFAAFYAINSIMVLAILYYVRRLRLYATRPAVGPLAIGALVALPISAVFLIDVAAPAILRLPYHHCPYDLVPLAPESVLAIASFLLGSFAVGWSCVAAWLADCPETRHFLGESIRRILVLGLFGYLGALVMTSIELALA